MKDFLEYILSNIADHPDDITIAEETEDDIIRFNVRLNDEDYPKVIGKRGMTIKAITELVRLHNAQHNPDDTSRIYINIKSDDEFDETE